ncbi:phosphomannose isomerase type i protein [Cystoisospora suis]|uniref:mannose-6-phosphate isomerase n=1 Tax=Cystoisospora suis TaxID=483139 RepID=A0A2C6KIX4_9APIC|nr:phosphomannose isomerase type i protein [Cystoisospora suis]
MTLLSQLGGACGTRGLMLGEGCDHGVSPLAVQLVPFVQHYAWGMPADEALVHSLFTASTVLTVDSTRSAELDSSTTDPGASGGKPSPVGPFAELWMGAHPSGMNRVGGVFWGAATKLEEEGGCLQGPQSGVHAGAGVGSKGTPHARQSISGDSADEICFGYEGTGSTSLQGLALPEFISRFPCFMGGENNLPFLFKVLSVKKPLSIQTHPDRQLAEILHRRHPDHFPDSNHKPECAIAVGSFEVLCGFRRVEEVVFFLQNTPELLEAVGGDSFLNESGARDLIKERMKKSEPVSQPGERRQAPGVSSQENRRACGNAEAELLKSIFCRILTMSELTVKSTLCALVERLKISTKNGDTSNEKPRAMESEEDYDMALRTANDVALRLYAAHGSDVGVFAAYFLNYIRLSSGQGVFVGPNVPHCYIAGQCLECMANSDNVIRGGLTPKYKDVELLLSSLRFDLQGPYGVLSPEPAFLPATTQGSVGTSVVAYDPHVEDLTEFRIYKLRAQRGYPLENCGDILRRAPGMVLVLSCPCPALLHVTRGDEDARIPLHFGQVLFVSAGSTLSLQTEETEQTAGDLSHSAASSSKALAAAEAQRQSRLDTLLAADDKDSVLLFLITFGYHVVGES